MLTLPGASVSVSPGDPAQGQCPEQGLPVICMTGNRRGMASIASIISCLYHDSWRQEFLPLTALPFVRREGLLAVSLRVTDDVEEGSLGCVRKLDSQSQFEWQIAADDLLRIAGCFFRLASSEARLHQHFPKPRAFAENSHGVVGDAQISAFASEEW